MYSWDETRSELTEHDKAILPDVVAKVPLAASLLVSGEASLATLGDVAVMDLMRLNAVMERRGYQSLFRLTDRKTIRMARFSYRVWDLVSDDIISEAFTKEAWRLGLPMWTRTFHNFHRGCIRMNNLSDKYMVLDDEQTSVYINACLLFDKAWTYEIPPSLFFCNFSFRGLEGTLKSLTATQRELVRDEMDMDSDRLTFREYEAIISIMDGSYA